VCCTFISPARFSGLVQIKRVSGESCPEAGHAPSRLWDDGIPVRFLLSGHGSTKRFVDGYEYIRIYLLEDLFDARWLVQNFLSVLCKPTYVEVRR
jgi:hypothetical protein